MKARSLLVVIGMLTLITLSTLIASSQPARSPWSYHPQVQRFWNYRTMEGDRIILRYPDIMSDDTARALLENRRRALEFVEEFLQVELENPLMIQINVSLIALSGRVIDPNVPSILFNIPFHRMQSTPTLSEGNAHEETHVVAYCAWSALPSQAVNEGLAVAVDIRARPRNTYDPHLLSKGLALRGELMAIEPLFSQPFEVPRPPLTSREVLCTYSETASFVLFLIDQYGLERFQRLYRVSLAPIPSFGEAFCRIYDEELAHVERDWLGFLGGYAVGREARAKYFVQATFDFSDRALDALSELEEYWSKFAFELVSPSEKVSNEYETLTRLHIALGSASEQGMAPNEVDEAYDAFERALTAIQSLSTTWLEALRTFEDVLDFMADADDYESIVAKLKKAQVLYRKVGDEGMVTRTGEYITAFQLLQEGEFALMEGNRVLADDSLSRALGLFSKLDEQQMVRQVSRLLEFSRCVLMR